LPSRFKDEAIVMRVDHPAICNESRDMKAPKETSRGPKKAQPPQPKLVVIGNGMAAGRALEELFERAPGRYGVTIFGSEPRVNYDRIMLSPVLAGEKSFSDIIIHDDAWYAKHGVTRQARRRPHRGRRHGGDGRRDPSECAPG
jgi:hypothetical protein